MAISRCPRCTVPLTGDEARSGSCGACGMSWLPPETDAAREPSDENAPDDFPALASVWSSCKAVFSGKAFQFEMRSAPDACEFCGVGPTTLYVLFLRLVGVSAGVMVHRRRWFNVKAHGCAECLCKIRRFSRNRWFVIPLYLLPLAGLFTGFALAPLIDKENVGLVGMIGGVGLCCLLFWGVHYYTRHRLRRFLGSFRAATAEALRSFSELTGGGSRFLVVRRRLPAGERYVRLGEVIPSRPLRL
jgi:hypothetical protein